MCERSRLIFVGQASEEVGMPLCVLKSRRDLRARPWQLDGSSLPCTVLSKAHYNCGWQVACYMEQHRLDLSVSYPGTTRAAVLVAINTESRCV